MAYNQKNNSVDRQIRVQMEESYCLLADVSFSYVENNRILLQFNNNFPDQNLQIKTKNCQIKSHDIIEYEDVDEDDLPLPNKTIHRDIIIAMRRDDGEVRFACPTFNGIEPRLTWIYENESWIVTDFDRRTHHLIYKD